MWGDNDLKEKSLRECVCVSVYMCSSFVFVTHPLVLSYYKTLIICLKPQTVRQLFVVSIWNLFFSFSLSPWQVHTHTHAHIYTHTATSLLWKHANLPNDQLIISATCRIQSPSSFSSLPFHPLLSTLSLLFFILLFLVLHMRNCWQCGKLYFSHQLVAVLVSICHTKYRKCTNLTFCTKNKQVVKHSLHHWGAAVTHGDDDKPDPLTTTGLMPSLSVKMKNNR